MCPKAHLGNSATAKRGFPVVLRLSKTLKSVPAMESLQHVPIFYPAPMILANFCGEKWPISSSPGLARPMAMPSPSRKGYPFLRVPSPSVRTIPGKLEFRSVMVSSPPVWATPSQTVSGSCSVILRSESFFPTHRTPVPIRASWARMGRPNQKRPGYIALHLDFDQSGSLPLHGKPIFIR